MLFQEKELPKRKKSIIYCIGVEPEISEAVMAHEKKKTNYSDMFVQNNILEQNYATV